MFRIPFLVAVALVVAFGGAVWFTDRALDLTTGFGSIRLGPWEAFPDAQTADADPYAKAHRARAGRLLYGGAEGLSFAARSDQNGDALRANCRYMVKGLTPPARFWTLFVTDYRDQALNAGTDLPNGINSWLVERGADNNFAIALSREARPGNWIALSGQSRFKLVLTLLDTPAAGSAGVIDLAMPLIVREGCGDA